MINNMKIITEERFNDMFNMLPPANWKSASDSESFVYPEAYDFNVYCTYIRVQNQFFECHATANTSHNELKAAAVQYTQHILTS